MSRRTFVAIFAVAAAGAAGLAFSMYAAAQPMGQMPMMQTGSQMPMNPAATGQQMAQMTQQMNQMMQQMQRQMAQMEASIKALRKQLDKVNPDLLTGQQRAMYDYLKLLQAHLDTMVPMMQMSGETMGMMPMMMQMMMQMPGSGR